MRVLVPDIGDFADVPVVEVLVAAGQEVAVEDPLIVLESDKASMEIPAPAAGVVRELLVSEGDLVSEGTPIAELESAAAGSDGAGAAPSAPAAPPTPERGEHHAQVLVLGSGPGGYTAAFRAADLGLDVVLVERYASLGGVCLNVGCIPSKALLHAASVMAQAETIGDHGIRFEAPVVDLDQVRSWKDAVVGRLTGGVAGMAKGRQVRVLQGEGRFTGSHALDVDGVEVTFEHAIVAAGSRAIRLPGVPYDDPRVMDSTDALELAEVPRRLLVIGGGIIGLEMATVYDALGAEVTVVELAEQLIPGCDPDVVKPLHKRIAGRYAAIHTATAVEAVDARDDGLHVRLSSGETGVFDRVLVAVGRAPNGAALGLEAAGVTVDERGYVSVDERQRTNVAHIFAIGDVAGDPMLAHKATHEAKVAAEVIAGHDVVWDARGVPFVAYTDPEVAWIGLTELEAKAQGVACRTAVFPWSASGRALGVDAADGRTKLVLDAETGRILGAGIVGAGAGELIAEIGLALELGSDAEDLALTIHPHPTLSETVGLAAEVGAGTITDLPNPRAARSR